MVEKIFAALMLAVCVLLLARMLLGARWRTRLDTALLRFGTAAGRRWRAATTWPMARRRAGRAAQEAIERARRQAGGNWEGNVYRPKSFKKKKRDLH